ncbi:glycosyltransferase family 4 protein [Ferroplasma acidarmanus]|uniref:Lipopolysaccharide N-acetylglucosaminyltransferase n=1 Tax=Ferroplasma acidarmanus Fer1 TaxID=333146 RepID=S0ASW4_FERAC|nr:glycosyltransferase [Ferroplasma acidarmanus]AGO61882.1 lipopolysaccharide N-acetylglucosaminyltransferase [Ferroplasma acidarmanus Fer1]
MRIAIFANGILFNRVGGAQKHMREVIERLATHYEIYYFPEPQAYLDRSKCNSEYIVHLAKLKVVISEYFIQYKGDKININGIIEKYSKDISTCELIYDLDFQYYFENIKYGGELSLLMSNKTGIKLGVCLQDLGDVNMHFVPEIYSGYKFARIAPKLSGLVAGIALYDYTNRKLTMLKLTGARNLGFITMVNRSYTTNMKINFKNIYMLEPSNALDTGIKNFRGKEKENKIIFFARLVYRKGIFDFILIVKEIVKSLRVEVVVAGQFQHSYEERYFFELLSKYHLEKFVKYKGKLTDDELYSELSTAKAMVYPSHSDSFSISILQAIYLNTPVVAYDIAGISVYKKFNCVKLVKEFDTTAIANKTIDIMNGEKVDFIDPALDSFIEQHISWDRVANAHMEIIDKYIA